MKNTDLEDLYALDECSILLTTTIKKVVAKRGSKPVMRIERRYKGVNIIAAISGSKKVVFQILEDRSNKFEVIEFLDYLRHCNGYRPANVILDNSNMHRNKEVYASAAENAIELLFQPTHSPFLNGVEELWRQLRQWLRGRLFFSLERLKDVIYGFFVNNPVVNIDIVSYFS
jgi:transposase